MTSQTPKLRIGYVPEHFSTPLHFAQAHHNLDAHLVPFPSGTGHMVTAIRGGEIDMAVGLTEGWVAAYAKARTSASGPGFRIVGTYVESALRWAICTGGSQRKALGLKEVKKVEELKGATVGVSRIGSGSYVMSYVLAEQNGWLKSKSEAEAEAKAQPPFPVKVLDTFANLREGVNTGAADFFMWEYFTTKKYFEGESSESTSGSVENPISHIGDLYSPWPSWMIVASTASEPAAVSAALEAVNKGIAHYQQNPEEAVQYIVSNLDYSEEDARAWMPTVTFAGDVSVEPGRKVLGDVVRILRTAGVLEEGEGME